MNIQLKKVKDSEKDILYRLLQFALYDGSLYIDNKINNNAIFDYPYFDAYFSDSTRDKYFIMVDDSLAGFVLINEYNKFNKYGKTIAEFLIMPEFRRNQIGTKAATLAFEKYLKGVDSIILHADYLGVSNWMNGSWKINEKYIQAIKNEIDK